MSLEMCRSTHVLCLSALCFLLSFINSYGLAENAFDNPITRVQIKNRAPFQKSPNRIYHAGALKKFKSSANILGRSKESTKSHSRKAKMFTARKSDSKLTRSQHVSNLQDEIMKKKTEEGELRLTSLSNVYREFHVNLGNFHWEKILSTVPIGTALLGDLIITAASNPDWSLIGHSHEELTHLRRPNSYRATLVQISNALNDSLHNFEAWMSELQMKAIEVPNGIKRLVQFIQSDPIESKVDKLLPRLLDPFMEAAKMGYNQSAQVVTSFQNLLNLTGEVIDVLAKLDRPHKNEKTVDDLKRLVQNWSDVFTFYKRMSRVVDVTAAIEFLTFYYKMESTRTIGRHDANRWIRVVQTDWIRNQMVRTDQAAYIVYEMAHSFLNVSNRFIVPQLITLDKLIKEHREPDELAAGRLQLMAGAYNATRSISDSILGTRVRILENIALREGWIINSDVSTSSPNLFPIL